MTRLGELIAHADEEIRQQGNPELTTLPISARMAVLMVIACRITANARPGTSFMALVEISLGLVETLRAAGYPACTALAMSEEVMSGREIEDYEKAMKAAAKAAKAAATRKANAENPKPAAPSPEARRAPPEAPPTPPPVPSEEQFSLFG